MLNSQLTEYSLLDGLLWEPYSAKDLLHDDEKDGDNNNDDDNDDDDSQ